MASVLTRVVPDPLGSAFQSNQIAQLTGLYSSAASETGVAIGADARCRIDWTARFPLVLASLQQDIGNWQLRIRATFAPGAAEARALESATFAQHSEAGATAPLYAPVLAADAQSVPGFELGLEAERVEPDGTVTAIGAADVAALIEVRVMEGALGRLLYLLGQEDIRIRRTARELSRMRSLDTARDDALDRLGAEVGVARFQDEIAYDKNLNEILTRRFTAGGDPIRESDADYARRLRIYRPFGLATRPRIEHALNGPGAANEPNAGLMKNIAGGHRLTLLEADNEFAIAIQLVSVGGAEFRDRFLQQLRIDRLLWPADSGAANAVHAGRYASASQQQEDTDLRASLRQSFALADDAALAPHLARALDRAGRLGRSVGFNTPWQILRAQAADGGSRYVLGLGADIAMPAAAAADDLRTRLLDAATPLPAEHELRMLVESIRAQPPPAVADDEELSWFWRACGLDTVHRVDAGTLYLSHFPTFGLVISGPTATPANAMISLEARYHAPGDPGANVVLVEGLAATLAEWTSAGNTAWTELSDDDAKARWATVPTRALGAPFIAVLQGAGLLAVLDPAPVVGALNQLPGELVQTIELDAVFSASIFGGEPAAIGRLRDLISRLQDHGITSVLPLIGSANEVLLVTAAIGLPKAGINLSDRRATGFRWYAVGIGQPSTSVTAGIKAVGSRSAFTAPGPGLFAIVTLGYARRGLTDPYEISVELPDAALLDVKQYEFLMNFLKHMCPIGVEVNTYSVRREHVDLDGDGVVDPLPPAIFRTFRDFRARRRLGSYEAEPESP